MFHINNQRLLTLLQDFSQFGRTENNGVTRLTLSDEDKQARDYFIQLARQADFSIKVDAIGNIFARREGKQPQLSPILIGSHGDSQPLGGRYDGIYGVLAGLEVLLSLNDHKIETERPIDLVMWTNEEGARFAPAMMGAAVFTGKLSLDEAYQKRDKNGITVKSELERIGYIGQDDFSNYHPLAALEIHIEQGPILENHHTDVGVVTGALGQNWYQIQFDGLASHAGTTPMNMRQDAGVAMAEAMVKFNELGMQEVENQGRVTVGSVQLTPNSPNVIPGRANFTLEIRHPSQESLDSLDKAIRQILHDIAAKQNLGMTINQVVQLAPLHFNQALIDTVCQTAEKLDYRWEYIVSGAGHDSCHLNDKMPTAMIFIPCIDGLSHNEAENITDKWCEIGGNMLLNSVLALANSTNSHYNTAQILESKDK